MTDPVLFRPRRQLDNENAIEVLEELLAEARTGEITNVVVGYARPDGAIGTRISEGAAGPVMAAAALAFHRAMRGDEED